MGINSGGYKLLLLLHILAVVIGIGGVSLNGVFGREAKQRQGPEGRAITEAVEYVTRIASYVIYLIPVFGILLVLASDDVFEFSDAWIWLSMLLYIVAVGVSHGVLIRNTRLMIMLMRDLEATPPTPGAGGPPPQVAELERLGRMQGMAGGTLHLLLVALIALMIWKPGG
jgi:uncharacterized membrane protein